MFCVHRVFKYNKLAVGFKLTIVIVFVVLYIYLNCAADKTIDEGHIDCNVLTVTINCRIILLMMLFITSLCKSLQADPSREICTYAT